MLDELVRVGFRAFNACALQAAKIGVGSPPPIGFGLVALETTGRKSGLPRQVPVLAARWGNRLAVSTVREQSQWLANAEATPSVLVWRNGSPRPATASVRRGPLSIVRLEQNPSPSSSSTV